jgi:antitoxin (DNA-binding transcriptional repressor) of toxin-antitoxin stability system
MKTLTVAEAQADLRKWLGLVARGEEIAISTGEDVIALRPVDAGVTEYARQEYGVTDEEMTRFIAATDAEFARLEATGGLLKFDTPEALRAYVEKVARD